MARYAANRLMQALLLLVIVSALGFAILHLAPGGPLSQFAVSSQMSQEDLDRVSRQLGLDRPLPIQYLDWFGRMLRGDWGRSYRDGEPVLSVIGSHLGAMLEVVNQDYIRTARAKGMPEWRILTLHALRNALLPMITVAGLQFPTLLGGALVTETVFTWPGMGRLFLDSIGYRDYPVVMGI